MCWRYLHLSVVISLCNYFTLYRFMDFWLYRIGLWVLLFTLELFVGTFDFLALGIAAFITAIFTNILGIGFDDRQQSGLIFLIASIVAIMISRVIVAPKMHGAGRPSPMSGDAIVGQTFRVQEANGKSVIKYEWVYRNIDSDSDYAVWDKIKVLGMSDNVVSVQKI